MGIRPPMTGLVESAPGAHPSPRVSAGGARSCGGSRGRGRRLAAPPRRKQRPAARRPQRPGPRLADTARRARVFVRAPIYWAGPRKGFSYELTRTADGRTYVRYLPHGVPAGDRRAEFLVVGTYERPHAFSDLRRAATRTGAGSVKLGRGGVLVFTETPAAERVLQPSRRDQPGRGLRAVRRDRARSRVARRDQADPLAGAAGAPERLLAAAFAARARMKSRSESRFR